MRFGHRCCDLCCGKLGEQARGAARWRTGFDHQRNGIAKHSIDGRSEFFAVGCIDKSGREQCGDMLELAEIGGDQRIGRRNGSIGNANPDRREPEQQMLDFIARQDDQRPILRQPGIEQRLTERLDSFNDLSIAEFAPIAGLAVAIGDHERVGRFFRPLRNRIDDRARIGRQLLARAHMDNTVLRPLGTRRHMAHPDLANGRRLFRHSQPPS